MLFHTVVTTLHKSRSQSAGEGEWKLDCLWPLSGHDKAVPHNGSHQIPSTTTRKEGPGKTTIQDDVPSEKNVTRLCGRGSRLLSWTLVTSGKFTVVMPHSTIMICVNIEFTKARLVKQWLMFGFLFAKNVHIMALHLAPFFLLLVCLVTLVQVVLTFYFIVYWDSFWTGPHHLCIQMFRFQDSHLTLTSQIDPIFCVNET